MIRATLALTALFAATAAFAQTTPPSTTAEPPTSTTPQEQSPPPATSESDTNASTSSADRQALMNDCLKQVQAANPNVSDNDVRKFCENEINGASQPPRQ